jgi:mono/diheme cytochrome c family protein
MLLLLVLSGLAITAGAMAAPPPSATPRAPDVVYAQACGYCHDHGTAPVILGQELDAEAIAYMVRSGPHGMPAFRPTEVSPAELDAVSKWISESPAQDGGEK